MLSDGLWIVLVLPILAALYCFGRVIYFKFFHPEKVLRLIPLVVGGVLLLAAGIWYLMILNDR